VSGKGGDIVWDKLELAEGGGECGEHVVADPKGRKTRHAGGCVRVGEHEEEDLADVVVTLEIAKVGLATEDFGYEVRELFFSEVHLL
jgi:hypothetical protein